MDRAIVDRTPLPPGRRLLVVSDIHGHLPFFQALMDKVALTPLYTIVIISMKPLGKQKAGMAGMFYRRGSGCTYNGRAGVNLWNKKWEQKSRRCARQGG